MNEQFVSSITTLTVEIPINVGVSTKITSLVMDIAQLFGAKLVGMTSNKTMRKITFDCQDLNFKEAISNLPFVFLTTTTQEKPMKSNNTNKSNASGSETNNNKQKIDEIKRKSEPILLVLLIGGILASLFLIVSMIHTSSNSNNRYTDEYKRSVGR